MIPKSYSPISVTPHDIYVGDTEVVTVTLPKDATGTVTIEIDGKEYSTQNIVNGKAVFKVNGLKFGDKTVAVKYSGDSKYRDNYTTGQFKVIKRPTTITASGSFGCGFCINQLIKVIYDQDCIPSISSPIK